MKSLKRAFSSALLTLFLLALMVAFSTASATSGNLEYANISAIPTQRYTGSPVTPSVVVECFGTKLTENADYVLSYSNNLNIGMGNVTITGIGNYTGTKTLSFTILAAGVGHLDVSGISDRTYSENISQYTHTITVMDGDTELTENVDYRITYQDNSRPGTGYVILHGLGNYAGRRIFEFEITKPTVSANIPLTYSNRNKQTTVTAGTKLYFLMEDIRNVGIVSSFTVKDSSGAAVHSQSVSSWPYSSYTNVISSHILDSTGTYTISYTISGYSLVTSGGQYVCRPSYGGSTYTQKITVVSASSSSGGSVSRVSILPYADFRANSIFLPAEITVNAAGAPAYLSWKSSNPQVASVDAWGMVTFLSPGSTVITATAPNGKYDSLAIDVAPLQISAIVKSIFLYRVEHGYTCQLYGSQGLLTPREDYSISFREDGTDVIVSIKGRGLYTGVLERRIRRPLLSPLGSTMQRSGEILVDIAPELYSGHGTVLTAFYSEGGQFQSYEQLLISDLSKGYTALLQPKGDPNGYFKTFFLDSTTLTPIGDPSGDLINPPLTEQEQAERDALAKEVADVLRTYARTNHYYQSSTSFYKSRFTANGYQGEIWSYDDGFTIILNYPTYILNFRMDSNGYITKYFNYMEYIDGAWRDASFSFAPSTYVPNGPVNVAGYYDENVLDGEAEEQFAQSASNAVTRILNMLETFLQPYGKSVSATGLLNFLQSS